MYWQKNSEACPQARPCRPGAWRVEGVDPVGLLGLEDRLFALRLQAQARRAGRSQANAELMKHFHILE